MPFDPPDLVPIGTVQPLPVHEPEPEAPLPPGTTPAGHVVQKGYDAFQAALRQENTLGSWWSHRLGLDAPPDPSFDPFAGLEGTKYADYADAFAEANTPEETARVKARIDLEETDRQTLAESGSLGVVASLAAGLLDPILLVPVGGAAAEGGTVLEAGARTAAAGFLAMSASEAALHASQTTRTYGESAINIASGTLLAGILGGVAGKLALRDRTRVLRAMEQDLSLKAMAYASATDPDKVGMTLEDILGPGASERDLSSIKAMASGGEAAAPTESAPPAAMEAIGETPAMEKLSKAFGVEKLTSMLRLSPMLDVMVRAKSARARAIALHIADLPVELEKNVAGIGTEASLEARLRAYDSLRGKLVREGDRQYRNYRRRVAGKEAIPADAVQDFRNRIANAGAVAGDLIPGRPKRVSRSEFMEKAGIAATQGDVRAVGPAAQEITELARFYRKHLFDPIQAKLEGAGLLPEGVKPTTAISYLMRLYKAEVLRQDPGDGFVKLAANWYMATTPEASEAGALAAAHQIRQKILGTPGGRLPYEAMEIGAPKATHARSFTVDDAELHRLGVLETNLETVGSHYLRTMAADIEMTRAFGTTRWDESNPGFKAIVEEYDGLAAAAKGPERSKLHRERDDVLRKIGAMWDRLRGSNVAGTSIPPDSLVRRVPMAVRQLTTLGMGGNFAINSMTDFGRIVMHGGLMRTMGTALKAVRTGMEGLNLTLRELEQAGVGFETLLETRANSMADIGDEFRPTTAFERGLQGATRNFFLINGLSPLTTMQKQFAGLMVHQRILESAEKLVAGVALRARDVRDLASIGLGTKELAAIGRNGAAWDRAKALWVSHTEKWSDAKTVEAFQLALRRAVDRAIPTPGVGDVPIPLTSSELGKLIGQFRTFNFAAVNSALIPLLQKARHGDAAAMSGLLAQVFLGMGVYYAISKLADKKVSGDTGTWVAEGIDRSGALGFYSDINNMIEVMSRGTIGVNALAGGPILSRYAGRNYLGAILGPQVSRMEDIAKLTGALSTGEVSSADTRSMRRMLPYQNVFYLDRLFDLVEHQANRALNIPETGK